MLSHAPYVRDAAQSRLFSYYKRWHCNVAKASSAHDQPGRDPGYMRKHPKGIAVYAKRRTEKYGLPIGG